ncbi:MAG: CSLREA domain-containing protein, partial [Chloroflexi bacterium]|nr:CSLREA domain-containing protein [Chloroflexota bacterium]
MHTNLNPIRKQSLDKNVPFSWLRYTVLLTAVFLFLSLVSPAAAINLAVNTDDDIDDGYCDVEHCSLREAINAANNEEEGGSSITFSIPETYWAVIKPLTPLPAVTMPVEINNYTGSTYVDLSGVDMTTPGNGLTIDSGDSSVIGMTIHDFDGHGILLTSVGGNLIEYNDIYDNNGDGIRITGGSGALTGNYIYNNGGLGIDLGGDGVTVNDPGDPDSGPNDFINYPVIIRSMPNDEYGTFVEGIYNGLPDSDYMLEFFYNYTCDPSGFGEGENSLGFIYITTDENGNASFAETLYGEGEGGYEGEFWSEFITATATDEFDNTSEFSQCAEIGPGNDSWPRGLGLDLIPDEVSPEVMTAVHTQFIDKHDQSRWFKFAVEPGSQLIVTLTNLPENYDLTVYKDIAAAYNELINPQNTSDLLELSAEFAPDAFSPDAFSPDAFSPDAFSPDAFSPDAFSPDAFSPDAFSPDAFSPDAFSPDAFSPDAFSPDAFSPDAFSPDAFSSAQTRSLLSVSAFNGTAGEGILINTWEND